MVEEEGCSPKDATPNKAPPEEPKSDAIFARLPRILSALEQARASGKNASKWVADALSMLAALQKLGRTLTLLVSHARDAAKHNRAHEGAAHEQLIDADTLDEIRAQFQELIDQFPDAGELFFGVDALDDFTRKFFDGSASPELLGAVGELGGFLDAQLSGFVERLIDWAFDEGIAGFRSEDRQFERLEEFFRGLENLTQEVLDRWVLPGIYNFNDDDDDSQGRYSG